MKQQNSLMKKLRETYRMEKAVSRLLEIQIQNNYKYAKVNKYIMELLRESRAQVNNLREKLLVD